MTIATSALTVVPKRFSDLRLLLIESEKSSLEHHAYMLSHNSYRVTTTLEVATGLSKILNGESYDCVLIDADISEIDMADFLHQTFKHQPHLSIIMMASHNIRMRLLKETLENEALLCLPKPCDDRDICNIWKHVCRKRISFEGCSYSNGESPQEIQEPNIFKRVDPMVKQSTTLNPTFINNNLSSGSDTQGLNIKSLEYDTMFKPDSYEEVRSNDHDQEHVDELKRTNDQLVEYDKYYKKRKDKRVSWTRVLHKKFVEAINALGNQKAYPTAILEAMKVPGLTRSQIASHLQKYQEHQKTIKKPTLIPQKEKQVESYAYERCGLSTPANDYESILQSNNIQRPPLTLNSTGMSYMTINNIKARLQVAPSLHVPQQKTTINKSYSDQSTYHSFCNTSMAETSKITTFGLVESCNSSIGPRNEFQMTSNSYESATGPLEDGETMAMTPVNFNEVVAPIDATSSMKPLNYAGIDIEQWVSGMVPSYYGLETGLKGLEGFAVGGENYDPKMREISNMFGMTNSDGGRTSASSNHNYLIHSQHLQGNCDNLSPTFPHTIVDHDDVENYINQNFSNSNLVPFGVGSVGYSIPRFPSEEKNKQAQTLPPFNCLVSMDGIERRIVESDLFADETQYLLEMTVDLLDELDADLINGPW